MARSNQPDPHRWQQDIYVGWAPWRFVRWWAANKFWVAGAVLVLPLIGVLLTGGLGLLAVVGVLAVSFTTKFFRDRRRGIGFTRNNEIVVFGPHTPIVIPSSSIQSLGVMRMNRLLSLNLQGEDAEIMPNQDRWYQKIFAYAGFRSEAPIRAKDAAAAREMSLASGRGLLVVIRDKEGTFWTVSTATGYEVATLRDLAALARVNFITAGDPFGRRPAPNRNPKRQQSKKVNRARIDHLPDRETLRDYGLHELRSPSRFRAFLAANTGFWDGALPEEWIPQIGLQSPSSDEMAAGRRRTRLGVAAGVLVSLLLVIVIPVAAMAVWPVTTGGVLTASWPRPYERLWDTPAGWTVSEKEADFITMTRDGNADATLRVGVADGDPELDTCELLLQEYVFSSLVEAGAEVPADPPTPERRGDWETLQVSPGRSVWCRAEPNDGFVRLTSAEATNVPADDAFAALNATSTRINE